MNAILPGGRIDRITQPEKDTIVLLVRAGAANHRLLLCASPNNARCHFTNLNFPNPLEPPMFCMLLRKQILSGRILSIQQMHGDRVIHVDIDTVNELGDHVLRRLVLEIMGRHSNLMLLDEDGRILEAARHVSADMSRVRQIQPGLPYLPPPAQDKIAPEDADAENLLAKLEAQGDVPLQKALAASVSGLSNPAAKELAYRVLPAGSDRMDNLPETAARLAELLRRLPQMADPRVLEDEQGEPADIFPFPIWIGRSRTRLCRRRSNAISARVTSRIASTRRARPWSSCSRGRLSAAKRNSPSRRRTCPAPRGWTNTASWARLSTRTCGS